MPLFSDTYSLHDPGQGLVSTYHFRLPAIIATGGHYNRSGQTLHLHFIYFLIFLSKHRTYD